MRLNPRSVTEIASRLAESAAETVCSEAGGFTMARWMISLQSAHRVALLSLRLGHGPGTALRAATRAARCAGRA